MLSVTPEPVMDPEFRDVAPSAFAIPGLDFFEIGTADDFIRWAFPLFKADSDAFYVSGSNETIRRMSAEGLPVCGHVGLIPSRRTWTGGYKAVGKTLESAQLVWRQVKALEEAGAFMAEMEVVPEAIATAITERSSLFMISKGGGSGCHGQYLFSEDVLGSNPGHVPRHAKKYRDFAAEFAGLQQERIGAFGEYAADVASGRYPGPEHKLSVDGEVLGRFSLWPESQ